MKHFAIALGLSILCFLPAPAKADQALVLQTLNLRSGPHTSLPIVTTLRRNERVELLGCISGYQWCEVRTDRDDYGWVASYYLREVIGNNTYSIVDNYGRPYGNTTIIIYKPRQYWDNHYRDRDFYKDRDRWFRDANDDRDHGNWHDGRPGRGHDRDDDDHGHHGNGPKPEKPVKEYKYKPMEMPGNKGYNPLCPMGQKTC